MRRSISSVLPPAILIAAVSLNAVLAMVNGHVMSLSRVHVILAEVAIYAAALGVILTHADRRMLPWFLMTLFIVLNGLAIALGNGDFNPKYIRDVLVIPVFGMLGMTYCGHRLTTPLLILHTMVVVVAAMELATPNAFEELFKVLDYYVNTRDFSANSFWNGDSKLFISATRPGERFFSFVDWHRTSSLFLEPVSLGNYCAVAAILIVLCWPELSLAARAYLTCSTLFLLIGSDGRLATGSIGLALTASIFLRNVTSRWTILYLPISLAIAAFYVFEFGDPTKATDNFLGRVAGTIVELSRIDVAGLSGMAARTAESNADDGITYFILTQSVLGAAIIWSFICLSLQGLMPKTRVYVHSVAIFIPLNLLVSHSIFSIKVASLIWFSFGYLYLREREAPWQPLSAQPVQGITLRPAP